MDKQDGFTLVEILMVTVLMAIILSIAIPTYLSWLPNIRMREASRDLFLDMQLAKVEAIKRNVHVVVAFTSVACAGLPNAVPAPGGSYTVFVDNGAGAAANNNAWDAGEMILATKVMPKDVALCAETFGGNVGFLPTGLSVGSNFGSATLNNNRGRKAVVTISIAGGIKLD